MRVVSITDFNNGIGVFIEREGEYQQYRLFSDGRKKLLFKYPKDEYGDYEKFWNIMSKWDDETRFLKEPIEISEAQFNLEDINKLRSRNE